MLAATHEAIGGDPAELERLILASDQSRLQAGIALSAATRTTWPPKVIALGRALAAGLMATDDARINTEPLIMAALADIEFPQASLLELLTRHWPRLTKEGGLTAELFTARPGDTSAPWAAGQRIWLPGDPGARVRRCVRSCLAFSEHCSVMVWQLTATALSILSGGPPGRCSSGLSVILRRSYPREQAA